MTDRKYYEAYDDRYRQVHAENLQWFSEAPSNIVVQTIEHFEITKEKSILEIGCGEGRDARPLLKQGCSLLATDISPEAIRYCRQLDPDHASSYSVLDCVRGNIEKHFDFIYAVAVLHMLVEDADRAAFYQFIAGHLSPEGVALICTMGDGTFERCSDTSTAFDLQQRIHEESGRILQIAGTSCRMVSFPTFEAELSRHNLVIMDKGITSVEPDSSEMMYAVVRKG